MWDVFLSYSSRDAVVADRVREALCARKLTVWHDVERIRQLDDIPSALADALASTRLTVMLVSHHHSSSRVCQWEALKSLALGDTLGLDRIALVLLDDSLPDLAPSLRRRRALTLNADDASLASAVEAIMNHPALRSVGIPESTLATHPLVGLPGTSGNRFVFRLSTMLDMHAELAAGMRDADAGVVRGQPVAVLHGMGGAGKSSTALFYVEQFGHAYTRGTAWLSIGGDRMDNEVTDDADRALALRAAADGLWAWCRTVDFEVCERVAPTLPAEPEGRWMALRDGVGRWLRPEDRLLLVLDDVPGGLDLEDLIPRDPRVAVLATSRDAQAAGAGYRHITLTSFTLFESMLLLTRAVDHGDNRGRRDHDPWDGNRAQAEAIAESVGHHPLAVDLIANSLASGERLTAIQREIDGHNDDFFDVAREVIKLPGRHNPSIMATIAGSLRGAASDPIQRADRQRVLRLLMVLPAGSRIPIALLEAVLGHSPKRTYKFLQNRSIVSYDGATDAVWCHALTRGVARYLWQQQDDPFGDTGSIEPALSRTVTAWLTRHMSRQGQSDLRVGAADALACLAVLDEMGSGGDEHRVQRSEAHLALAREAYRTGVTDLNDCEKALEQVDAAKGAVSQSESDWLSMAWWSAEAMRGLILRSRTHPSITPDLTRQERGEAVDEAAAICEDADNARQLIGERLLAHTVDGPDPNWVRNKLASSMYNLTGFLIRQAQVEADRTHPDSERIAALLARMDELHVQVMDLRMQLDDVDWAALASSVRGRGIVSYHQAMLLPLLPDKRRELLEVAVAHVVESVLVRRDSGVQDETHDEIDVSKSLELALKTCWASDALQHGIGPSLEHALRDLELAGREVGALNCSTSYRPGKVRAGASSAQQLFRDGQSNQLDALVPLARERSLLASDCAGLSLLSARWLTVAHRSRDMGKVDPRGVFDAFFGRGDKPGETRWFIDPAG